MSEGPHSRTPHAVRAVRVWQWCVVLAVMLASLAISVPVTGEKGKPLSVTDVRDLLTGAAPSSEIAQVVAENGISFRMFPELEKQFRNLGATDELIDALNKASKPDATPPAPAPTGVLKIQSQPGEAQVYLNDLPRGNTNAAGNLELDGITPGTYHIRVSLSGYKSWENSVTIVRGENSVFASLEKQTFTPTVALNADRSSIQAGESVTLSWTSLNAADVDIEPGVGKVALSGSTTVSPRESTTYTLTAIGPGGIKTATATITVTAAPPPPPVPVPAVVGNLPGFPVPGASFKELKFFESGQNPLPLGQRTYASQFDHSTARFVDWELHITCPKVVSRVDYAINTTWYFPTGGVFAKETVNTWAQPGWTEPVINSGRGWARPGMWKRGTYRVDIYVNGSRIASGSFTIF